MFTRARFVFGLAATMVLVKAMPAMAATSWEVCLNPVAVESGGDLNVSVEGEIVSGNVLPIFFTALASVYSAGTFQPSTAHSPRTNCHTSAKPIGQFFARADLVANLPTATNNKLPYVYYVDWHLHVVGGQFGTSGFVKSGNPGVAFSQIVTGSAGGVTSPGPATVLLLSNAGDTFNDKVDVFEITLP